MTFCSAAQQAKLAGRAATEGQVAMYIHTGGKIGVLVEVNCITDFAARSSEFQALCKDLGMQIAAAAPRFVKREDVPEALLTAEREIYAAQARQSGKPDAVIDKIASGKMVIAPPTFQVGLDRLPLSGWNHQQQDHGRRQEHLPYPCEHQSHNTSTGPLNPNKFWSSPS